MKIENSFEFGDYSIVNGGLLYEGTYQVLYEVLVRRYVYLPLRISFSAFAIDWILRFLGSRHEVLGAVLSVYSVKFCCTD